MDKTCYYISGGDSYMKKQLRNYMLTYLRNLNISKKQEIENKMYENLFEQTFWQQAKIVGITYATSLEWNTKVIIQRGWDENKKVVLPVCNRKNKTMNFFQINDFNELESGYANILEPSNHSNKVMMNEWIDLLIVPGVVFNVKGYRIGYGGGFFDRYLSEPIHKTTTVSLAAESQLKENLPTDSYDIPVDYIITENRCIQTSNE